MTEQTSFPDIMTLDRAACDVTPMDALLVRYSGVPARVRHCSRPDVLRVFLEEHPGADAARDIAIIARIRALHPEASSIAARLAELHDVDYIQDADRQSIMDELTDASECAVYSAWGAVVDAGNLAAVKAFHKRFSKRLMSALGAPELA